MPSAPENSDQNIRTIGGTNQRPYGGHRNSPPRREPYRGDNRHQRTPLGSGMPLPGHFKSREPPPPGFEDGNDRRYEDENRPPPGQQQGPMGMPLMGMGFPPNMMPPGFMPPGMMGPGPPGMFRKFSSDLLKIFI